MIASAIRGKGVRRMKKSTKHEQTPPTLEEIRARFGQIRGAENQKLATRAFVIGMAVLHYSILMLDRAPENLSSAEQIEIDFFTDGLHFESDDHLGLATEMLDGIARRQHN